MTPSPPPSAPVLAWHRRVAFFALAWGLLEMGAGVWLGGVLLRSSEGSPEAPFMASMAVTVVFLSALGTLFLPASPLLIRRRLSLALYQLAAVPPVLFIAFMLIMLVSQIVHGGSDLYYMVAVGLALVLGRGALAAALLSVSRRRARMYEP